MPGPANHVVMLDELYGGTHAFATDLFDRLGIKYSFAATDANAVAQAVHAGHQDDCHRVAD